MGEIMIAAVRLMADEVIAWAAALKALRRTP